MPRRKPRTRVEKSAQGGRHIPVLLALVIEALRPTDGETYLDMTYGAGGYTRAILQAADCQMVAFDRDPTAIADAEPARAEFGTRLKLLQEPFGNLLNKAQDGAGGFAQCFDGVVFDLGVSSMQIDTPERGFSFQSDGPLDMRMSASSASAPEGPSAADVVNTYDEADIADILYGLAEERRSRAIAKAIVARRQKEPFSRTLELAELVGTVLGRGPPGKHPTTRTFQALRMYVNDELGQLIQGLAGAERALRPGGRLVVVTFHSIEDRIVKRFIATRSGKSKGVSRHMPASIESLRPPSFQIINSRSLTSSKAELEANPRARSARLRAAVRTTNDAWPLDWSGLGVPQLKG